MSRMTFEETVQYVRAAIDNDIDMYTSLCSNVDLIKQHGRRYFGELCVEFALLDMPKIRNAFPWLEFGYEHLCAALDELVSDFE